MFSEKAVDADVRALYKMGFFSDVKASLDQQAGEWVLTYHVTERPFVKDVKVEGNKKIDTEELEGALRVRPNTIFDPEKARKGIEEAKKLYEKKGYLDAVIDYQTTPVDEDEVEVTFKVDEKEPVRIDKIVFEGNRAFSDRQLKKILATKESWFLSFLTGAGNLDREVLQTDTERLTAYYYEHGYIDVRVDDPMIERVKDALQVTFKIDEGKVYDFGKIEMAGEILPDLDMEHVNLHADGGETFRPSKLREDINLLTEAYGDRGYAFVNVTPQTDINPDSRTVDVTYKVNRGPEVYIDRIEISGNVKTRDKVIRRELELQEQKRFSGSKLRRSQQRLKRLGFFEDVNITTRKADRDDRLDVIVDVKEGSTGAFSAGAGVSSGESFLFNVRLSEINLFGRGQRLVFNADFGSIRRNISLSFTEPYFLDTNLSLGVDAYNWQLIFDEFTRGGTGGSIRTLYPFTALGWNQLWGASLVDTRFGLDYRIEQADISDVDVTAASVIRAEQGTSLTSSITPRIYRDTRNSPFDPTDGSLQDFSIELAGLGGTASSSSSSRARAGTTRSGRARGSESSPSPPGGPSATDWATGANGICRCSSAISPAASIRCAATVSARWAPGFPCSARARDRIDQMSAGRQLVRPIGPERRDRWKRATDLQQRDHLSARAIARSQGRGLLRRRPGVLRGRGDPIQRHAYRGRLRVALAFTHWSAANRDRLPAQSTSRRRHPVGVVLVRRTAVDETNREEAVQ